MKIIITGILLGLLAALFAGNVRAHDHSHPDQDEWYKGLMQPDAPMTSCCGEADSYYADSFEQEKGQYVAIITDERDDGPLKRPHIEIGTRIVIPNNKIKYSDGNPTGHGVLFVSRAPYFYVYCYVPPGGV